MVGDALVSRAHAWWVPSSSAPVPDARSIGESYVPCGRCTQSHFGCRDLSEERCLAREKPPREHMRCDISAACATTVSRQCEGPAAGTDPCFTGLYGRSDTVRSFRADATGARKATENHV